MGRPSFPPEYKFYLLDKNGSCVNALNGATFISTNRGNNMKEITMKGVNALNGATFISTLASGNPHE